MANKKFNLFKYEDITPLSVLETPIEKTQMHLCVLGVYFEEKYCLCIAIRNSEYIAMKKGRLYFSGAVSSPG